MKEMRVLAPAKVNLGLNVLRKLANGYHEIDTVFASIDLYDELIFTASDDNRIVVRCDHPEVPQDESNLAYQAAVLLQSQAKVRRGVTIQINKSIPVGGGLAGGSTDAAAVLRTLPKLWNEKISFSEQQVLAKKLGADVMFCLQGGTQRGRGLGEELTSISNRCRFKVAIIPQPLKVSTAKVYQMWDRTSARTKCDIDAIVYAMENNSFEQLAANLANSLEPVTFSMFPQLQQQKRILEDAGLPTLMSGSGATLFCLVVDNSQVEALERCLSSPFYLCSTLNCIPDSEYKKY